MEIHRDRDGDAIVDLFDSADLRKMPKKLALNRLRKRPLVTYVDPQELPAYLAAEEARREIETNPDATPAADLPKSANKRRQSEHERKALQALIEKHGKDYAAMARDVKLNTRLLSAGQLRRRLERPL